MRALERGVDFFFGFTEAELHDHWSVYGEEITDLHVATDPTLRPAAWWWWTAPERIRVEYRDRLCPTEQRERLLSARLLDAEAAKTARQRIEKSRASGVPVAAFDLHEPRIEIPL